MNDGAAEQKIRIFLVDDHEIVREGLRRMLARCPDVQVIGTAGDGDEALLAIPGCAPDVVLLDLRMPGKPGLEVLRELKRVANGPRVLVLTVHDDPDLVLDAVHSGADGYVLKHTSKSELLAAIRRVAGGGHHFDEAVLQALVQGDQRQSEDPGLTARETDVLRLLAAGLSNKEIGRELFLSPDTVKSHLANLYRKLGVDGRTRAVALALRKRLLE